MAATYIDLKTQKMIGYHEDGIGWMVYNQPERRNAVNREMNEAIPVILGAFAKDPSVRVVVITGAGDKSFVAGADISEFESRRATPEQIAEFDRISGAAAASYKKLGKPIIAMIRGFCMGGGMLTAMRADIRICTPDSQFGVPAAKLGLGYSYESVAKMVELFGPVYTREILVTGEKFDAEAALRMGLVNRVAPPEQLETEVKKLARIIADNAPMTVRALRIAIDEAVKGAHGDSAMVDKLMAECFASEDYKEGRRAFMEKRKPSFQDR
jgi:enoyl-CoA hydratase/carnithine racemase